MPQKVTLKKVIIIGFLSAPYQNESIANLYCLEKLENLKNLIRCYAHCLK
ncbi:hypothetical protein URS_0329 [Acinetobacter ursingii]|nr:hypothetical protein URS_0329 [Acinetobacter ursingii]